MFLRAGENQKDVVTQVQVEGELAAHGHSILEVEAGPKGWQVVPGPLFAPYQRFKNDLWCRWAGGRPFTYENARGPSGYQDQRHLWQLFWWRDTLGNDLNCRGKFHYYFGGDPAGLPEEKHLLRYSVNGRAGIGSWRFFERFDMNKVVNESNRFGWMVEYKPTDPSYRPKKRTALGRFCHEGAALTLSASGHAVAFMGDDSYFEYLYRFVSAKPAQNNPEVLDGTLSVARFTSDGSVAWLPLRFGEGPLTPKNGLSLKRMW